MDNFHFSGGTFAMADDGEWLLDRDWTVHPPTQLEVEALLARALLLDHLLTTFIRLFGKGNIVAATELDDASRGEVARFLWAVRDAMTPPTVEHPELTAAPLELAEVGDCIRDQLHALDSTPNPSRAADVAANLDGARRAALRERGALLKEVTP